MKKVAVGLLAITIIGLIVSRFNLKPKPATANQPQFVKASLFSPWAFESKHQGELSTSVKTTNTGGVVQIASAKSAVDFELPFAGQQLMQTAPNQLTFTAASGLTTVYEVQPNRIKESIILPAPPSTKNQALSTTFTIPLKTTNLSIYMTPDNLPIFKDAASGEYRFHIETPFAVDAAGVKTYAVTYTLKPKNNLAQTITYPQLPNQLKLLAAPTKISLPNQDYVLVMDLDPAWLADPARVYPITIDPTVVHDTQTEFASGTLTRVKDTGSADNSPNLEGYYQELGSDPHTVGLWHLDEASGNAVDSSGNSNTGTATGTTVVSGLFGNARSFNGTSDYISKSSFTSYGRSRTVEFWFKPAALGSQRGIISVGNSTADTTPNWIIIQTSGNLLAVYHGGSYRNGTTTLQANQWYHAAYTYDASTTATNLYLNGNLEYSGFVAESNNRTTLYVGTGYGGFFSGLIDEVKYSDTVLTPKEILSHSRRRSNATYTSPVIDTNLNSIWNSLTWTTSSLTTGDSETATASAQSALVAQWSFNETSGTTAVSGGSCGTSCNLTLNNFASTGSQDEAIGSGWTAINRRWGTGAIMLSSATTADYLSLSDPASNVLDPNSSDLTIETWIKTTDLSAQLLTNNNNNGTACTNNGYYLGIDANGYALFYLDTNGATAGCDVQITSTKKINDGAWHHLVVTVIRGTSSTIYIDGTANNVDASVTSYSSVTVAGTIYSGGSAGGYDGLLDVTRVYSRALSPAEIVSNYNAASINFQTRSGPSSVPDNTWDAWKPTTTETVIDSMDNPLDWATPAASIWTGGALIATSAATFPVAEGSRSLKIQTGQTTSLTGLVGLWHLDETGGTSAYLKDATANANHGTPTGTTLIDGIAGKARSFNGTSDYLLLTNNSNSLDYGTNFSVEAWVKTSVVGWRWIIAREYGSWLGINASGNLTWTRTGGTDYVSSANIANGRWHHVAVTFDNGSLTLYVDGFNVGNWTGVTLNGTAGNIYVGQRSDNAEYFSGQIDEIKISNITRTANEIAESYRLGRDHRITKLISATDLSINNKFPFYIASDRKGTFMSFSLDETAFANSEPDANTAGLWHLDEQTGSGAYLKDVSGNGNHATPTNTLLADGVVGSSRYLDGSGDYLTIPDNNSLDLGNTFTLSAWIFPNSLSGRMNVYSSSNNNTAGAFWLEVGPGNGGTNRITAATNGTYVADTVNYVLTSGSWHYIAYSRNGSGSTHTFYVDGQAVPLNSNGSTAYTDNAVDKLIGARTSSSQVFNGMIDELRLDNLVRTAEEIRQAYEVGKRTHTVTIDFKAKLDSGNLITGSSDTGFTVDETAYGATTNALNLFLNDIIIVKENYDGTEYLAQGQVSAVNSSTGAVMVASWDPASSFPASGFTSAATVFKWQREYVDLSAAQPSHINATTSLTWRLLDGNQAATIWLDDLRATSPYLSAPTGSTVSSNPNRYFQYRAIWTSTDPAVSASLNSVSLDYTNPNLPTPTNCVATMNYQTKVLTPSWVDTNTQESGYEIERSVDGGDYAAFQTTAANVTSYPDSTISDNHQYTYRIRAFYTASPNINSDWCVTNTFNNSVGTFRFNGINMQGIKIY